MNGNRERVNLKGREGRRWKQKVLICPLRRMMECRKEKRSIRQN